VFWLHISNESLNIMRLIQSHKTREAEVPTPESVFAAKYEWLFRWAMHFTQNDRAVAEDLAQDAFVRLIVSWPRIKDNIEQVEPFLYSSLKYAHLMELRRGRRFNFRDLALIEFDDLRLSLKEEKTADPIEVQDDLRRIVAYLCWRKRSAKSASILLLRFFHGYFPEEIVRIALISRNSVDRMLSIAREEVKAYLTDPSRIEVMRQGQPPELMPRQVAVSPERLADELRTTIFQARTLACLERKHLLQRYQAIASKPIPTELLAHIVNCERCLNAIHSIFDFPSPSQRTSDGMAASSRRSKRGSGPTVSGLQEEIRRTIAGGRERFRKLYEHHPRGLMISVNGDVLAMRDVNSATSELKVQTGPDKAPTLIDVLSEQGISLLNLYVPSTPPEAPPELRHEIALSDNRKLELVLRFTSEGAVIELHYNEPLFLPVANASSAFEFEEEYEEAAEIIAASSYEPELVPVNVTPRRRSWWRRVLDRMTSMVLPEMNPMLATAMICMVAAIVFLFLSFRASSVMKPEALLTQAATTETASARLGASGVIVQAVRVQTRHRKLERTLYRDVQGKRRLRERPTSQEDAALRSQLETWGIVWNDPLSAGSFRDWHDHVNVGQDVVKRTGTGLLTLTTTLEGGTVASESLTVRETDFHPVGRTVELRNDAGTVEIAELNYSVLPWSSVNPDLFESISDAGRALSGNVHPSILPHIPRGVSAEEMDLAELSARLVLNRLGFDDSGRIEIRRDVDGVHIQGIVDTETQKSQLRAQLLLVPHVLPSILTVQEMADNPTPISPDTTIRQSSDDAQAPSSLERYFVEHGLDHKELSPAAQAFVEGSFVVKHETEQVASLLQRFSTNTTLPNRARTALGELLVQHRTALLTALGREERALMVSKLIAAPSGAAAMTADNPQSLREDAERNFALCVELTSDTTTTTRPAQIIAPQLAESIAALRAAALEISTTTLPHPLPPGDAGLAKKN
jgi:RNA polymerase sigma factor (sigma-70 family)